MASHDTHEGRYMETLSHATARLRREGFTRSFRAEAGRLVADDGRGFRPEELRISRVLRFEGESDPADASILFALETADGRLRGLYSAIHGAGVSSADAGVIQALGEGDRR